MYRSILALGFVLFVLSSERVLAQTAPSKKQSFTSTTNQSEATGTPGSAEPNPEAKSLYDEGVKRVEMGEISEAVDRFQRAVKLDPEYADAYSALGRAFFKLRQWENASGNLRRAIALRAAKERERQEVLQKNRGRRIVGSTVPLGPERSKGGNRNPSDTKITPGLTSAPVAHPGPNPVLASQQIKSGESGASRNTVQTLAPPSRVSTEPQPIKNTKPIEATPAQTRPARESDATAAAKVLTPNSRNNASAEVAATLAAVRPPAPPIDRVLPQPQQKATVTVRSLTAITNGTLQEAGTAQTPSVELFRAEPKEAQQPNATASVLSGDEPEPLRPTPVQPDPELAMNVTPPPVTIATASTKPPTDEVALTNIYRVGPGDVLDIYLNDPQSRRPAAFIVTASGLLEHPKLSEPLAVTGLTVEEIANKIEADLKKHALIDNPKAIIGVLDSPSHAIVVSGLVKDPGTKFLKHDAVPLVMVLADAQPLPEAARVIVERNGVNQIETELNHTADLDFLVHPGDTVTLQPGINQSFYIAGKVKFPGEKTYRIGLTLMQAVMTAGGGKSKATVAEIGRDDGHGLFVRTRFDLQEIESGKVADPLLKPGDRITILR